MLSSIGYIPPAEAEAGIKGSGTFFRKFHDALAFELEKRLGVRDLAGLPGNAGQPVVTVRTDVRRFDSLPGVHAALDVVWSLELGNQQQPHPALTCASVISEVATTEVDSLVLAHQRAIGQLAEVIAGTARKWAVDSATACP